MRGGLPLSLSPPLLVCLFLLSCAQPTDSTDEGIVERERVEVSGSISEDAVWESGKEYVVTGDVTVEAPISQNFCSPKATRCMLLYSVSLSSISSEEMVLSI